MRIDIHADPPFRAESLRHSAAVRVGNIVTAAEYDNSLAVVKKLLHDGDVRVVRFLKRTAQVYVPEIEDVVPDIERRKPIELRPDRVGSQCGTFAAVVAADAFVL